MIVALSGSVALLADTLHNLGHLATTIPLIIAFRLGRRAPTRRYSYGFRRAEDLVGLLIGAVIALSAGLIVCESVRALTGARDMTRLGWVLAAALVGAAGNELVAMYRIRAGRRIGSAALIAEAASGSPRRARSRPRSRPPCIASCPIWSASACAPSAVPPRGDPRAPRHRRVGPGSRTDRTGRPGRIEEPGARGGTPYDVLDPAAQEDTDARRHCSR